MIETASKMFKPVTTAATANQSSILTLATVTTTATTAATATIAAARLTLMRMASYWPLTAILWYLGSSASVSSTPSIIQSNPKSSLYSHIKSIHDNCIGS
jgi:hypothetical protein